MTTTDTHWAKVEAALTGAHSIAFDGCHKIYVLLDDEQTAQQEAWGYRENDKPGGSRLYTVGEVDFLSTRVGPQVVHGGLRRLGTDADVLGDQGLEQPTQ